MLRKFKRVSILLTVSIFITILYDLYTESNVQIVDSRVGDEAAVCKTPYLSNADSIARHFMSLEKLEQECDVLNGSFVRITDVVVNISYVEYQIELNINDFMRAFNLNDDSEIVCYAEQFEKKFNVSEEHGSETLRLVNFTASANFTIRVQDHGYYEVACDMLNEDKERLYEDQYFILPYNMSLLFEERKRHTEQEAREIKFLDKDSSFVVEKKMNVLMIRIDSMSFPHLKRSMPLLHDYLTNRLEDGIMFTNANTVAENTHPNLIPLLTGIVVEGIESLDVASELEFYKAMDEGFHDKYPLIWYDYENAGYLTGFQEDLAKIGMFHFQKPGFRYKPTSFYGYPLTARMKKHKGSCTHGRSKAKVLFDNMEAFLERMHTVEQNAHIPYFFTTFFAEYTHKCLKVPEDFDKYFTDKLVRFEEKGYLNNTLLYIYSDHGNRFVEYSYDTASGKIEKNYPFLSLRLPRQLRGTIYEEALRENRDKLISFYDQYQFLRHFLHLNANYSREMDRRQFAMNAKDTRYLRGVSLFENIKANRSCPEAMIPYNYCKCLEKITMNETEFSLKTGRSVDDVADFLVESVNNKTRDMREMCVPFKKEFIRKVQGYSGMNIYQIELALSPGDAWFQSSISVQNGQFSLYGKIIRLSLYGNQSHCVHDSILKNYCFCREQYQKV